MRPKTQISPSTNIVLKLHHVRRLALRWRQTSCCPPVSGGIETNVDAHFKEPAPPHTHPQSRSAEITTESSKINQRGRLTDCSGYSALRQSICARPLWELNCHYHQQFREPELKGKEWNAGLRTGKRTGPERGGGGAFIEARFKIRTRLPPNKLAGDSRRFGIWCKSSVYLKGAWD